jgi:hypothetical protein
MQDTCQKKKRHTWVAARANRATQPAMTAHLGSSWQLRVAVGARIVWRLCPDRLVTLNGEANRTRETIDLSASVDSRTIADVTADCLESGAEDIVAD